MDPMLWLQAENSKKQSDPAPDIVKMLLECIILLCQRRGVREELRKRKVYPICRNLDYMQEDEGVSTTILEIVNLLMGEEDPATPIDLPPPPPPSTLLLTATTAATVPDSDAIASISAAFSSGVGGHGGEADCEKQARLAAELESVD